MNISSKKVLTVIAIMGLVASSMLFVLAALPPAVGAPGDSKLEPYWVDNIIDNLNVVEQACFNTSTQDITISWTYGGAQVDQIPTEIRVSIYNQGLGTNVVLYVWNYTSAIPKNVPSLFTWRLNRTFEPRPDYIINVTGVNYDNSTELYYADGEEHIFSIKDGSDMVRGVAATTDNVVNDGSHYVNITWRVNRSESDISVLKYNIWSESDGEWVVPSAMVPDQNMMPSVGAVDLWLNWTVPLDQPSGAYKFYVHAIDDWMYSEEYNSTLFNVVWYEVPPEVSNATIYVHEDSFAVVDLNDHIVDKNMQPLSFFIDGSSLQNIMITWVDSHTVNITASPDWNGVATLPVGVNDTVNNVTLTLDVHIAAAPDELQESASSVRLVKVMEDLGEATFDPTTFFYDPDGPASFVVSLGWEWFTNETNVTTRVPIWTVEEGNLSVWINETDTKSGKVWMIADIENGTFEFPATAWVSGVPVLNSTFSVEIVPVNDIPSPLSETLTIFKNEAFTADIRSLFVDADGPENGLNFSVNATMVDDNLTVSYDPSTYELSMVPAVNWTGSSQFLVNATDGIGFKEYIMIISVVPKTFKVSGKVTFEDNATHLLNVTNDKLVATLTFGTQTVTTDNTTFSYEIVLAEGTYSVSIALNLPTDKLYSASAMRSGYVVPVLPNITLDSDKTVNVEVEWKEYSASASWTDLDFENYNISELGDDGLEILLGVKDPTKTGYDLLNVYFVIRNNKDKDDDNNQFKMVWDPVSKQFKLTLTKDDLENVSEGKLQYYFGDGASEKSEVFSYEFKAEDENAGIVTVIVLIVLIILVLIALVFIMRKPSEEEFEDEGSEEEGSEERTCPSCNETVTDEDAEECPYCGEKMEEE